MKKIKRQFTKLLSDLRHKRKTKRVKLFFAGIACLALTIVIIVVAVIAGINKKKSVSDIVVPEQTASGDGNTSVEENISPDAETIPSVNDAETVEENIEEEDTGIYVKESADAGEEYLNETLFIGDSNTVRMMNYGITSVDNTIAVVGMGIQSVKTLQCVQFSGYSAPVTMIEAVKLMQPRRIIITFGTNNATGMPTDSFINQYRDALNAIHEAYPYADILINSIPPICKTNKYPKLSQTSIDDFNEGLKKLAEEMGYKYLDTASVMKDASTGFAKDGFTVNDGIHISDSGFAAMFTYIRTHSHVVEDTRPALAAVPKQQKATYVIDSSGKMNNDPDAYKEMSEVSKAEQEALKAQQEAALKAAQEEQAKAAQQKAQCTHSSTRQEVIREATESETGILRYICNNCGHTEDVTIPKKQATSSSSSQPAHVHAFTIEGSVTVQPTYDAPGKKTMKCSCGETTTVDIPKLTPPASSSTETPPVSSSTETPPADSTTETPPASSSTENPPPEPEPEPTPDPEPETTPVDQTDAQTDS